MDDDLGAVWRALGDPTRRLLVDRLGEGPKTTGDLCGLVPISRFGVMKHLEVLVEAGLVVVQRRGRERWNYLNAAPLQRLYERWVHPRAGAWAKAADRLGTMAGGDREASMAGKTGEAAELLDVLVQFPIAAAPEKVWRAMFDAPQSWWPGDFNAMANSTMAFEEKLGGRLYETTPSGGGVVWYTVMALDPGRSLTLAGYLSPKFGGPTTTLVTIDLEADGKGGTLFTLNDALHGRVGAGKAAVLEEGWRALFQTGLGAYAEQQAG